MAAGLLALAVVGGVASWVVFRAGSYQKLLTVQSGDFSSEIAEVAYELGFKYPAHFTRLFKNMVGCTPNRYRSRFD